MRRTGGEDRTFPLGIATRGEVLHTCSRNNFISRRAGNHAQVLEDPRVVHGAASGFMENDSETSPNLPINIPHLPHRRPSARAPEHRTDFPEQPRNLAVVNERIGAVQIAERLHEPMGPT